MLKKCSFKRDIVDTFYVSKNSAGRKIWRPPDGSRLFCATPV